MPLTFRASLQVIDSVGLRVLAYALVRAASRLIATQGIALFGPFRPIRTPCALKQKHSKLLIRHGLPQKLSDIGQLLPCPRRGWLRPRLAAPQLLRAIIALEWMSTRNSCACANWARNAPSRPSSRCADPSPVTRAPSCWCAKTAP